jgi:hypothetical protein
VCTERERERERVREEGGKGGEVEGLDLRCKDRKE